MSSQRVSQVQASPLMSFLRRPLLASLITGICIGTMLAADPQWWVVRGVRNMVNTPSDFSVLTIGQLKALALAAKTELDAVLADRGGAGGEVTAMVNHWLPLHQPPEGGGNSAAMDFAAANLGQLKAVAKPFYDRLIEEGLAENYPWTAATGDDVDFAAANLGQAKNVFNLPIPDSGGLSGPGGDGGIDDYAAMADKLNAFGYGSPFTSFNPLQNSGFHHTNDPRLSDRATAIDIPRNPETIENAPVAGVPGEFKTGPDGSARYTVAFDIPKGAGGLHPGERGQGATLDKMHLTEIRIAFTCVDAAQSSPPISWRL